MVTLKRHWIYIQYKFKHHFYLYLKDKEKTRITCDEKGDTKDFESAKEEMHRSYYQLLGLLRLCSYKMYMLLESSGDVFVAYIRNHKTVELYIEI